MYHYLVHYCNRGKKAWKDVLVLEGNNRDFSFSTTDGSATVVQLNVVVFSTTKIHPKYCQRNWGTTVPRVDACADDAKCHFYRRRTICCRKRKVPNVLCDDPGQFHRAAWLLFVLLKPVDYIGNCQRPVFSLGVSQAMHEITNLWKFELNWSSKLRDNNERKKHPCHTKLCAFRCLISRPQILRSRNQICGKLLLSQKLHYFRESRFPQFFILSTSPHYLLLSKVLC